MEATAFRLPTQHLSVFRAECHTRWATWALSVQAHQCVLHWLRRSRLGLRRASRRKPLLPICARGRYVGVQSPSWVLPHLVEVCLYVGFRPDPLRESFVGVD